MASVALVFPRRLLVNGVSVFAGEAIARFATFILAIVIARRFGQAALGAYGYALALASVLVVVPDPGLNLFTVRELSSDKHRLASIFWNVHWLKLALCGLVVAFAVAYSNWFIPDDVTRVLLYVLIARVVLQTFSQASMAVFKAFERMQYIALQQSVNSAVVVTWVGTALLLHARLPILVFALAAGQLAETLLGWWIVRDKFPPGDLTKANYRVLWALFLSCLPIGITTILEALNIRIDVLVLSSYGSNHAVGQFQAAAWFTVGTFLVASLLMTVLFPKLSRLLRQRSIRGSAYVLSLLKNGLLLTALLSLILWFVGPALLQVLLGADSAPTASILRILLPALPLMFLNTVLFYVFMAARRRFVCTGVLAVGVGVGTVLCFYLAGRSGASGVAMADVAREFVISASYLYFLIEGNHARAAGLALLKILAGATAAVILAVFLSSSQQHGDQWLAAWIAFVMTGTLLVMGFPRRREWRLLMDDAL